ncbi:MAG: aldo/keto reductase [Coleofasciculaceae cyanobacterium]
MLKTHKDYLAYLEKIRWDGTPKCPYCESTNSTAIKKENRHHCNTCFNSYSVTVGTVFHKTYVDLQKWFSAIPLVLNLQEAISARKLAKKIGVNKNTACYMIARIRKAIKEEPELLQKVIEAQMLEEESPIPGTKRRKYLEENIQAVNITLTEEELKQIDDVVPQGIATGDRYPDMSSVNR